MRTLVDTHALYWFIEGDDRLSEPAIDTIGDPENEILISPASYWEMAIKIKGAGACFIGVHHSSAVLRSAAFAAKVLGYFR